MARWLGAAQYGGFGVGLNAVTVLSKGLALGTVPATQYYGSKRDYTRADFLVTVVLLSLAISILIVVVALWVLPWAMSTYWLRQPTGYVVFCRMAPFIPFLVVGNALTIILIPWQRVGAYSVIQLLSGSLLPVLFALGILWFAPVTAATTCQAAVWVVLLAYNLWLVRSEFRGGRFSLSLTRKILAYGLAAWPTVLLSLGAARLVVLLGAAMISHEAMGLFVVGLNVSEAVFGFHSSLGQLLLSRVSAEESRAFPVTQQAMRISVVLLGIVAVLFLSFGRPVLLLLFGQDYAGSWPLSVVLLATGLTHSLGRILSSSLAGMGRPGCNTVTLGCEVLCLIGLVPVLSTHYGVFGLACASALAALAALGVSTLQSVRLMRCSLASLYLARVGDVFLVNRHIKQALGR
jgi:enterobacterial common antigen flippase